MDHRQDARDFMASRRARLTPEEAGLATYGDRRRVKGLRREEVAMLAGVSVDYYARLERGNLAGASESVLEAVARALQLDDAERQHLHDLARSSVSTPRRNRPERAATPRPAVLAILAGMTGVPAYVRNARMDILATNELCQALWTAGSTTTSSRSTWPGSCSWNPIPEASSSTGTLLPTTSPERCGCRPVVTRATGLCRI
jgi:transcriptional regulator with XRE-family HTH domain